MQRELTFYCRHGLTLPDAKQLQYLANQLRATIQFFNLTRGREADLDARLSILALGTHTGDLCQLVMTGADAELAKMVFTAWVNEHALLLGGRKLDFSLTEIRLAAAVPDLIFTPAMLQDIQLYTDKTEALRQLVSLLPSHQLLDSARLTRELQQRETISATSLCRGIAIPHVMSAGVLKPMLALIHTSNPVDWESAMGPARLLILMAVPAPASREQLAPLTHLVRNLMNPLLHQALLRADNRVARHAILIQALSPRAD